MKDILTRDKQHLMLFADNIAIDKRLPKWRNAEAGISKNNNSGYNLYTINTNTNVDFPLTNTSSFSTSNSDDFDPDAHIDARTSNISLYKTPEGIEFNELATLGIKDLTKLIAEKKLKYVVAGYGSFGSTITDMAFGASSDNNVTHKLLEELNTKMTPWYERLFNMFKKKKDDEVDERQGDDVMDIIKFFTMVKSTSKESVMTYKNRVEKYLIALHNATNIGQTALQEELIRGLITNRYESVLFSEGVYYAIGEEMMADFISKSERGIKLTYLKNFNRPIPQDVIDKITKMNELEVFDNYVILYYDPEGKLYKDTAEEEAKRRDPIIFGLIAGSKKLYYVADWIDEYCDLTLEKFVDTLGIDKDTLLIDKLEKSESNETKVKSKKHHKPRRRNKRTNKN